MTRIARASIAVACIASAIFAYFKISIPNAAPGDVQTRGGAAAGAGTGYLVVTGDSGCALSLAKGGASNQLLIPASLLKLAPGEPGLTQMFRLLGGVYIAQPMLEGPLTRAVGPDSNLFTDAAGKRYRAFYYTEQLDTAHVADNSVTPSLDDFTSGADDSFTHGANFAIEYRQFVDGGQLEIRVIGAFEPNTAVLPVIETIEISDFADGDYGIHLPPVFLPFGSADVGGGFDHTADFVAAFRPEAVAAYNAAVHAISDTAFTFSLMPGEVGNTAAL
jgi:hypothetical protein